MLGNRMCRFSLMKPNNHMNIRQNRPKDHQGQRRLLVMRTCHQGRAHTYGTGRESPKYIKQKPKWETIIVCNWWVRWATPSENTEPRGSTAKSYVCYQGSPEAWGTGCWEYIRNIHQGRQYPYRLQHLWSHTGNHTQPWSELETSNSSMLSFLNHRIFGH